MGSNQEYTAVFSYTIQEEILEQKDVSQFFYSVWKDKWPKRVNDLNIFITFPGPVEKITYFIHPPNLNSITHSASGNKIHIRSVNHPPEQYLEINAIMPKEWFSNLRKADNYMTAAEIIEGEKAYISQKEVMDSIIPIISLIISLAPIFVFVFLYIKYGRETNYPELNNLPPYIRDIEEIGDLSPSEAGVLYDPNLPNLYLHRFIAAEIMEMVRTGYLETLEKEIITVPIVNIKSKVTAFKPVPGKNLYNLTKVQAAIYEFICNNLVDGSFSFEEYKQKISPPITMRIISVTQLSARRAFVIFYKSLLKIINDLLDKRYIDQTGPQFAIYFSIIYIAIFIIWLFFFHNGNIGDVYIFTGLFTAAALLIISSYKKDILSRWTKEGRIKHEKLKRYKKFMEELTLMKEKRITDVVLWEKLLVYATVFGIANKVVNAMKINYPDYARNNSLVRLSLLSTALPSSAGNVISSSTGRSRGGFGGGFGGGRGSGGGMR